MNRGVLGILGYRVRNGRKDGQKGEEKLLKEELYGKKDRGGGADQIISAARTAFSTPGKKKKYKRQKKRRIPKGVNMKKKGLTAETMRKLWLFTT